VKLAEGMFLTKIEKKSPAQKGGAFFKITLLWNK
jgi:hypothetical protein